MAFDWKRLDREERARGHQQGVVFGLCLMGVALVGLPVAFALGRPGPAVTFAVVALLTGLPSVVLGLRAQRRDRAAGDD